MEIAYKGNKFVNDVLNKKYRIKAGTHIYRLVDSPGTSLSKVDEDTVDSINGIYCGNTTVQVHMAGYLGADGWVNLGDLTPIGGGTT